VTSLIDTHCHIDLPAFDKDREAILERARQAGVHAMIVIGHNPERWRTSAALTQRYPVLIRTAGLHPNDASDWSASTLADLTAEVESGEPIAVGETGLDFFRDSAPEALQREAFAAQIALAHCHDLPIVIHQRSAERQVLETLRDHGPVRGVMHCFSGNAEFARSCLEAGLMLGVGGVATYPRSEDVRAALAGAPLDSIILETDAPYLAPQPWRGKRNEPSYVVAAADVLADIHGLSREEIGARTTANAVRLFGERLESARQAGLGTAS
jgi:TatD DNase family protein